MNIILCTYLSISSTYLEVFMVIGIRNKRNIIQLENHVCIVTLINGF